MDTDRLRQFVQEVRDSTSPDDAFVRISGDDEEIDISGNRAGLLRLAAELVAVLSGPVDPAYLFKHAPTALIKNISVEDKPPEPPKPEPQSPRPWNKALGCGCATLIAVIVFCALVGFGRLIKAMLLGR